ncbi:hypothetical protein [Roseibium aggregatum]|uniref:DUF937 domain-containing protein n=1 Tax=Roseibium aggregatum TaxID=187304 RepID=A0A939EAE3_9HYPH|nr:hypothetical protein [Roseibium aggregatum]MBN9669007.1 hypothetical protein [Roseibium aggregatum]
MSGSDAAAPPFDIFSLTKDVHERFGWSNEDLSRVMEQLMPAAFKGFDYFGGAAPDFTGFMKPASSSASGFDLPFGGFPGFVQSSSETALTPFFGPESVQRALAGQISGLTGLQSDAIREMMPVAATLAMGQIARPFVHGEARNLLDAYLRGFARGRPKPQPTPVDYLQGYAEAMQSFWGAFLQPMRSASGDTGTPETELEEPDPDIEEAEMTGAETEPLPQDGGSEFDEMVSGWMAAGRDFQSNQFKAFDSFFEKAARDLRNS